jgi:hypothetical protein
VEVDDDVPDDVAVALIEQVEVAMEAVRLAENRPFGRA